MIDVSSNYKRAIKEPSRIFSSRITIANKVYSDIDIIAIYFDENLFLESEFCIGSAIMSAIEIEMRNTQEVIDDFKEGVEFKVEIGVETSENIFEYVSLGLFTIEDIDKNTFSIKVSANDRMINFEKDYVTNLLFPATLKQIAMDIAEKANIKLKNNSFINSDYIVSIKPEFKDVSLRKALMYISELAGGYARISRDGELEIFNINANVSNNMNYASQDLYTNEIIADELNGLDSNTVTGENFINFSNKAFTISSIDKVIVEIYGIKEELGHGENVYYIVDNIFCQDPAKVITNIYNALSKISYIPCDIKLQGNPAVQSGDSICIRHNGAIINTLLTSRSLKYLGGLTEEYKSVGKSNSEKQSTGKGNVAVEVNKVKTEIKIVAGEVEQKVSNDKFESYIKQTAEEIATKVTGEEVETLVKQNADSWELSINGKLTGKRYRFDGDGFTIGGDDDNVAKHTPYGSEYKFSDGSIAKINKDGFYNQFGTSKREYHHLSYTLEVAKTVVMPRNTNKYGNFYEEFIFLDIPSEFHNKNVTVTSMMTYKFFTVRVVNSTEATWGTIENNRLKVLVALNSYPIGTLKLNDEAEYMLLMNESHEATYKLSINLTA